MSLVAPIPDFDDSKSTKASSVSFNRILVALDASDHANRGLVEATRLVASAGGTVTGIHVYAAKLHDRRFRQMEGGLPEQFRKETEMERQREVHDSLITRGLDIISDSYHDGAALICEKAGMPYRRLSPEGKNYRRIVEATESGEFDVIVLGALGLGAVPNSTVGTVCERVVRRCPINVLVIRDPERALGAGPLVVGLDGSPQSFGALKTALELGRRLSAPVHAVAAYDPYFHYVAFHKISGVLSEEAAKEFRFKDQEKLHEEIIDSGLAKIYQSHLKIARDIAEGEGADLVCELLEGKPYQAIAAYLERVGASLLLLGKTGIHADPELDIGGNAENLLRMARCHVWLGQGTHTPSLEAVARETIAWTEEAEEKLLRVPEAMRAMVRTAILHFAQNSGHTVVTSALIDEATRRLCPHQSGATEQETDLQWSAEAIALLERIKDTATRANLRLRAEKHARRVQARTVSAAHVYPFLDENPSATPHGTTSKETAKESLKRADVTWTPEALKRLEKIPEGAMRTLTRQRVEAFARGHNLGIITPALMDEKYGQWASGSAKQKMSLKWQATARQRIDRIPEFVRGMVALEIERCAREMGKDTVTDEVVEKAIENWETSGRFHSEMNPNLHTKES